MNKLLRVLLIISFLATIQTRSMNTSSSSSSSSSSFMGKRPHDDWDYEHNEKVKKNVRSILLPTSNLSKIDRVRITADGIEIDLNERDYISGKTFAEIISNPDGAFLAYAHNTKQVFDALDTHCYISDQILCFVRAHTTGNFYQIDTSKQQIIEIVRKAIKGNSKAQNAFGFFLDRQGFHDEAKAWYEKAAAQKNCRALYNLGAQAYNEENYHHALQYFLEARDLGFCKAYHALSIMYENGEGVNQNPEQAKEYENMFTLLKKVAEESDIEEIYSDDNDESEQEPISVSYETTPEINEKAKKQ